jgi:hypothetical protein
MKAKQLFFLCILIVSFLGLKAQTFPGGLKPFISREAVEKIVPLKVDFSQYPVTGAGEFNSSARLNLDGVFYSAKCYFEHFKLTRMDLYFSPSDYDKAISSLKKKYKEVECDVKNVKCFKATGIEIRIVPGKGESMGIMACYALAELTF